MNNWMRILGLLVTATVVVAQEQDNFTLGPYKQVEEARVQAWNFGGRQPAKGVLVVTSDYGLNPSGSTLKEIEAWQNSAKQHGLALAFVNFKWTNLNVPKNPFDGGAELLGQIAAKVGGKGAPVFICSRNDPGNRFVLDCVDKNVPLLKGWMCYDNRTWKPNPRKSSGGAMPGIIAAATDSIWYNQARAYFITGRNAEKNWTWLGYNPIDAARTRDFAAQYFAALLSPSAEQQWREIATREAVQPSLLAEPSEGWSWLPDATTGEAWSKIQREQKSLPTVVEKEMDLSKEKLPNLKMYLRLPPGQKDAAGVSGVVAYCTWTQDRNVLVQQLSYDLNQPAERLGWPSVQLLRFATKHNLAVISWSTPGRWQTGGNSDELDKSLVKMDDKMFDIYARAWARGIEFFCTNYQMPRDNYLLYGMSRGAQWAHRLALRLPQYFLAVNPHVSGSYDRPTPEARRCLWLITVGEVDVGYENAIAFYQQCQAAGYPVLFKAGQDLAHETRADIEALRDAFFEYALTVKDRMKQQPDGTFFRKEAKFAGNYETQRVVPADQAAEIPEEYRVWLPTEEVADAWKLPPPE
ncbi:MAG: hypothetical protein LBK60_05820 [Verrucomicrobiales bacterium]|jgi:pimeloyl-ACP methyl ester carboxylesterase|nr:hypothetical protein [Verrucomicrobiales bacterium]